MVTGIVNSQFICALVNECRNTKCVIKQIYLGRPTGAIMGKKVADLTLVERKFGQPISPTLVVKDVKGLPALVCEDCLP